MMDRAERTGLGIALAGHVALFAALSLNLLKPPELPKIANDPVEVELVSEVAPISSAPTPSREAPAPAPAPMATPEPLPLPEPLAAPTPPPLPALKPAPKPAPRPKPVAKAPAAKPATAPPKPAAKPKPKPIQTAARATDTRQRRRPDRPGLSRELVAGLSDAPSARPSANPGRGSQTATPAQTAGPAVQASLGAEIRRQLKPHWKSPTGADVELLRTTLSVSLNRDGSLAGTPSVASQTGVNDSNRTQARLHADQAVKAVRLAAPFKLPAEFYDAWKEIRPTFDRRLSQ